LRKDREDKQHKLLSLRSLRSFAAMQCNFREVFNLAKFSERCSPMTNARFSMTISQFSFSTLVAAGRAGLDRKVAHSRQSTAASVFSVCSCSRSLVAAGRAVTSRLCVKSAGPPTFAGPAEDKTDRRQSAMDGESVFIPPASRPVRPIVTRAILAYKLPRSREKCKKCNASFSDGNPSTPCAPRQAVDCAPRLFRPNWRA